MIEQARGVAGNDGDVTHWPDHFAEMTWFRCIVDGCDARVDPWLHSTRCPHHQADADARLERVRAIVAAHREAEMTRR